MDDRQTFAIGETIRQKHLDAVARDADRIATQQEAIDELVAGLRQIIEAVEAPRYGDDSLWDDLIGYDENGPLATVRALLSKHGERT